MEVKALNKLTDQLIVPKYPWITKTKWTTAEYGGVTYWHYDIWPDREMDTDTKQFFEDTIGSWVSKFFEMVGRERNNYFDSVRIFTGFSGDKNYDPSYFFKGAKD